jgi:uroporphyrin-III C-methyltransferase
MRLPAGMPEFEPGWVWLAGAGPGDPGLLTLHVMNALAQADVVVHDALVGPEILGLARTGAILEYAGKRGHKTSTKQSEICARIVQLARRGKRVLRLKGGDPLVFGRGGEEALALVRAGVPFRILPGVSSGVGGLAYAGIPVTHRTTNSAVTFVTGHDAKGRLPADLDWDALAKGSPVLVVFMGLRHIGAIADRLMAGGRDPAEPVAVVSDASLPTQSVLETTLGRAAADVAASGLIAPALVVVGEVVRLRAAMDWLGALSGRTLVADGLGETGETAAG